MFISVDPIIYKKLKPVVYRILKKKFITVRKWYAAWTGTPEDYV